MKHTNTECRCKSCGKEIDPDQIEEATFDIARFRSGDYATRREVMGSHMNFDEIYYLDQLAKIPVVSKVTFRYHTKVYNVNGPSHNGAANFCAGYRKCGPVIEKISLARELDEIMD